MQQSVAHFEITYTQCLHEAGRAVQGFPEGQEGGAEGVIPESY